MGTFSPIFCTFIMFIFLLLKIVFKTWNYFHSGDLHLGFADELYDDLYYYFISLRCSDNLDFIFRTLKSNLLGRKVP